MATRGTRTAAPDTAETIESDGEWRAPVGQQNGALVAPSTMTFDDDDESPLERLLSSLKNSGGAASVKLYRKTDDAPRGEWCADFTIEDYESGGLRMIRKKFGPGHYFIWVYGPHPESGKFGRLARDDFNIARDAEAVAENPVAVASPSLDPIARAMESIAAGQAAILQALTQRPDPTAEMQRTLALMASMREAMGLNVQPAAPVAAPAPNPSAMLSEIVGAIKAIREVNAEIGGGKEEAEPGVMGLASKVIDIVQSGGASQMLAGIMGGGNGAQVPGVALPPSIAAAPALARPVENPAPETAPQPVEDMQILVLRGTLQGFLNMIGEGKPATEGGAYLADKLPEEMLPYLDLPNWHELLTMAGRTVGVQIPTDPASLEWLNAARVEAIRLLSEDVPD